MKRTKFLSFIFPDFEFVSNFEIRISNLLFAVLLILSLAACGGGGGEEQNSTATLPGSDKILATVNGSAISAYDLEQAIRTSLGPAAAGMLDAKGRKSVLDSLVAARAIAQAQEKTLTARERSALDKQTAAYREQLLVKMYLARNTASEPVSQKMVADYYQRHPQQFGAKTVKQYEVISSQGALPDARRDKLLAALKDADKHNDWAAWSEKLRQKGLAVDYKSGNADPAILSADLRSQLDALKAGQPASLNFAGGVVSLARVIAEKKIPPRPLNEVSVRIRKTLLPVQLKKAVKQASDKVLATANVEYKQK
jgi:EpsD family peptidyl-prolyl cis-trans isomerase